MRKSVLLLGISIAFLNLFDGIATNYGLSRKLIEEINPLMDQMISVSPFLFLGVKAALSLLILFVSYSVYAKSEAPFQKLYLVSLGIVFFIYCGICSIHLYWLTLI
ncbi:hypothetical protein D1B33_11090 [Lysinibacillus yapensis]|uniref:DUF5658 domain-containing protein n=1 Tax=Ureibacillus yapensis TaxID=2304605 RepID=A0A396SA78_9BACL|nr:DUF5658 family protein [Lysinibacillus yapensis]RHW36177.1 hypothetical protein D1B33_11090 [Lysinibacillus yapensis]